jgi:hypothetical protein
MLIRRQPRTLIETALELHAIKAEDRKWRSKELAHNRPPGARLNGSLAPCASIRCFKRPILRMFKLAV